jgi:hypothetical protein
MSTSPNTGAPVSVPIGALLQALHERYGKLIGQLMQENAELQAGVEMQAGELQYLRSLQEAQREPDEAPPSPWTPAPSSRPWTCSAVAPAPGQPPGGRAALSSGHARGPDHSVRASLRPRASLGGSSLGRPDGLARVVGDGADPHERQDGHADLDGLGTGHGVVGQRGGHDGPDGGHERAQVFTQGSGGP